MMTFLLVVHILLALALIGVILMQRSEGGALGIGGGGGFMTARGQANLLTRSTAILAALFIATSILLAILSGNRGTPRSILDAPAPTAPAAPAESQKPSVPLSQ
ncbi:preprotein translocase subunit SecG [uncultured Ferrovibrio sp.]|jgi:preprotein translocase subunit SecG|uniref:preprotein translocase subunit SecG n=1 Tax=uncultured Ferrovibrio sp. TaxID=1576913 RepID=UPI002636E53B|nr:preprotein translocase subunit SecG [uncultured Ferrovibrio sp.]